MQKLLESATQSICRPFKVRVAQSLKTLHSADADSGTAEVKNRT